MNRRKRQFKRSNPMSAMSEINVTSLLDLAFCLLIIFMISTPLIEANSSPQSIPLNLPTESPKEQAMPKETKYQDISIDTVGRIFWGSKEVTLDELNRLLAGVAKQANPPVIAIRADRTIPYQKVVTVLDYVRSNGLDQISLETQSD